MTTTTPPRSRSNKVTQFWDEKGFYIFWTALLFLVLVLLAIALGLSAVSAKSERASANEQIAHSLTEQFCAAPSPEQYRLVADLEDAPVFERKETYAYWKSPQTGLWEPLTSEGTIVKTDGPTPVTPPNTEPLNCDGQ